MGIKYICFQTQTLLATAAFMNGYTGMHQRPQSIMLAARKNSLDQHPEPELTEHLTAQSLLTDP